MVERKTLLSVLLAIVLASAAAYTIGRFSTLEKRVTTTATWTTTQTSYAFVTVTAHRTTTVTTTLSTDVREPPRTLPPPANSSAIVQSRLLLNGSLFLMVSIDKPVYSSGEPVHFKGSLTNLGPGSIGLWIEGLRVRVRNDTGVVWAYPQGEYFFPLVPSEIALEPRETITLDVLTGSWNLTGFHTEKIVLPDGGGLRIVLDDRPVPEGKYTIIWELYGARLVSEWSNSQDVNEGISFTIKE